MSGMKFATKSHLLIDESPHQLLPTLAVALGSAEAALFLQQIHYLIRHPDAKVKNGRAWFSRSMKEMLNIFPYIALRTMERIVRKLRDKKLLLTCKGSARSDHTLWYSINYEELHRLESSLSEKKTVKTIPPKWRDLETAKMAGSRNRQNGGISIVEDKDIRTTTHKVVVSKLNELDKKAKSIGANIPGKLREYVKSHGHEYVAEKINVVGEFMKSGKGRCAKSLLTDALANNYESPKRSRTAKPTAESEELANQRMKIIEEESKQQWELRQQEYSSSMQKDSAYH